MKKKLMLVLSVLMLIMGMAFAAQAKTAAKPTIAKKVVVYARKTNMENVLFRDGYKRADADGPAASYNLPVENFTSGATITNVKVANKKVGVYSSSYNLTQHTCYVDLKGFGRTKITFTVNQGGKKYKLSTTLIIKKAPSPLKKLTIDGKDYTKKLNGASVIEIPVTKTSVKVAYKWKNGFEYHTVSVTNRNSSTGGTTLSKMSGNTKADLWTIQGGKFPYGSIRLNYRYSDEMNQAIYAKYDSDTYQYTESITINLVKK